MKRNVLTLAAALLALVLSAATFAAPAPGGRGHQHGSDAAALGLTGDLATHWDALNQEMRQLRQERRRDGRAELDSTIAALSAGNPDVDALIKAHDARMDGLVAKERALRDQRVALYHQMSAQQQASARGVLLDRLNRMAQMRARWQHKRVGADQPQAQ